MALLTWVSLLFLVVAIVGSIAVAVLRGLRAWRTFKRFTRTTTAAMERVLETAAEAERHAVAFTESTEKLNAALAHLEQSRAELAVIQSAAAEARTSLTSFRGAVPRK
jgi:cell shape-determining protein MreC